MIAAAVATCLCVLVNNDMWSSKLKRGEKPSQSMFDFVVCKKKLCKVVHLGCLHLKDVVQGGPI